VEKITRNSGKITRNYEWKKLPETIVEIITRNLWKKLPGTVEKITRNYEHFFFWFTLCCKNCPLYIVVSCLGCVIVSCLVCTVVVVLSVLLSSYV
jgi:hypothetical protein